jgi:glycosyltransferase involved in cell wall biosynthesis
MSSTRTDLHPTDRTDSPSIGSAVDRNATASRPRVIVVQPGARHNYAIPRMLHRQGALAALYTDVCFPDRLGFADRALVRLMRLADPVVQRRTIDGALWPVTVRNRAVVAGQALSPVVGEAWGHRIDNFVLGAGAIVAGARDANIVYSMHGTGEAFLRFAKRRGLRIVSDIFITPIAHRIEQEEQAAFPEWGGRQLSRPLIRHLEARNRRVIALSDALVCPTPAVVDSLRAYPGFDERKAYIVPYGNSVRFGHPPAPRPGRVLFAGAAGLRKGIHYLARAADILMSRNSSIEIVVAGGVSDTVRNLPDTRNLTFLGHLGRAEMDREFLAADVFTLPSLAEGSAGVVFEAMAAGLPVVVTHSAGSVLSEGREGLIVPGRDPEALAGAIERIVTDRQLRQRMSEAARETAARYDEASWSRRLYEALIEILNRNGHQATPSPRQGI